MDGKSRRSSMIWPDSASSSYLLREPPGISTKTTTVDSATASRAVLARLLDEAAEEAEVLAGLGVPEDADDEAAVLGLEPFDRAVVRPREGHEALAEPAGPLVVVGLDLAALAEQRGGARAGREAHLVVPEDAGVELVLLVADDVGEVLHEVAAARDVQDLDAAADREHRHVPLERRAQERELRRVPLRANAVRLRVRVGAVVGRIEVGAAGEDEPVERVERLLHGLRRRRHDERPPARELDRANVRVGDERDRRVPDRPARLLHVRRDTDEGPH